MGCGMIHSKSLGRYMQHHENKWYNGWKIQVAEPIIIAEWKRWTQNKNSAWNKIWRGFKIHKLHFFPVKKNITIENPPLFLVTWYQNGGFSHGAMSVFRLGFDRDRAGFEWRVDTLGNHWCQHSHAGDTERWSSVGNLRVSSLKLEKGLGLVSRVFWCCLGMQCSEVDIYVDIEMVCNLVGIFI